MKIPYFYLEVGERKFFQPQNTYLGNREDLFISDEVTLSVSAHPADNGQTIYLNGGQVGHNFKILKIRNPKLIEAVKSVNNLYYQIPF